MENLPELPRERIHRDSASSSLDETEKMTVPKEVNEFLDKLIGRSPKTKENYESFARIFWGFVGKKGVADVTVEGIMEFLNNGMEKKNWKLTTMKQYAILAMRFFGEFRDEDFMKQLKKQVKLLPKVQSRAALYEGIYIPPDKIESFIRLGPTEEWAIFYTIILKWGLRLGEALKIAPVDIDPKKNRIVVRGKGIGGFGKIRQVFVEKSTITRVLKFAGCSQEQILGQRTIHYQDPIIRTIKERTAEYQWKETAKKAGLKNWKRLTVHDGRHSYAIDFLTKRKKEGMAALVLLKNQLGHSNITTTQIYLDIAGGEAQDVFDAGIQNADT